MNNQLIVKITQIALDYWMIIGSGLGLFLFASAQSINDILISCVIMISAFMSRGLFEIIGSIIESRITKIIKGNGK